MMANSGRMRRQAKSWLDSGGQALAGSGLFGIMGIINLTPDSFYDGGRHNTPDSALAHARNLLSAGASILDLGAESTRPGARALPWSEEWRRLEYVIAPCVALGAPVSVDTWHSQTASRALEQGARIINDVSACAWDPELAEVLGQYRPAYVLTHSAGRPLDMQNRPEYANVVDEVLNFFSQRLEFLGRAGLPENRIVLDPGIGFGKTLAHNLELLENSERFLEFGRPLLLGVSMKRLFGQLLGLPPRERGCPTAIASALLWQKGVFWHRAHDVGSVRQALLLASCLDDADNAAGMAVCQ